jgi:hypothetical protein
MDAGELSAREQIRDLVARYNANGDSGRLDAVMALFREDASLIIGPRTYAGVAQIRGMFEEAAAATRLQPGGFIRHFTATHQINLEAEDRASGRSYFQVLTEAGLDHWGRYLDRYASSVGVWKFEQRIVHVDARVPGGWSDRAQARLD